MFGGSKKPYSAVTVQIDRLTSEQYEEDDISGIIDLVEVIRIQESGPTEAARAIRKKLKYGNPHKQIRALVILDGLIQNAGGRFQRTFADEPLLERLRLLARDETVDGQVRQKCKVLFAQWASVYKKTPGLEHVADLYKQFPKSQKPAVARQKVLEDADPFESPEEHRDAQSSLNHSRTASSSQIQTTSPHTTRATATAATPSKSTPSSAAKKPKDKKFAATKPFNLAREKDNMTKAIAMSSMASINLLNSLQLINRESERVSENAEVIRRFDSCKNLRRQILYYIQHVESDDWIGSLVNANDDLVKALTAYEIMDRSISDDSDSDAWENPGASHPAQDQSSISDINKESFKSLEPASPPAKPRRPAPTTVFAPPANTSSVVEDEDDPFGDSNEVQD